METQFRIQQRPGGIEVEIGRAHENARILPAIKAASRGDKGQFAIEFA